MPRGLLGVIVAGLVAFAAPSGALAIGASFSFDTDAQGWQGDQGASFTPTPFNAAWSGLGGNPGGHIQLVDSEHSAIAIATLGSGTALSGDFSGAYGGTLSVDMKVGRAWSGSNYSPFLTLGAPGTLIICTFPTSAVPSDGQYHTITATLTETANPGCTWKTGLFDMGSTVSRSDLQTILSQLTSVSVEADVDQPVGESVSIDNVRLTGLPDTTITSTTPALISTSTTAITFTANPSTGTTFECQLDGGAFLACASPDQLTGLADGPHTFAVRSVLGALRDPTPAALSFAVDTRPLAIDTPPGTPPPTIKPKLENVSLSGGRLLFTSATAGTAELTIARATKGHRSGKGRPCSSRRKHGTPCTLYTTVFRTSHTATPGAGRFTFGRGALRRGSYRATLTLTAAGARPVSVVKTFTVK